MVHIACWHVKEKSGDDYAAYLNKLNPRESTNQWSRWSKFIQDCDQGQELEQYHCQPIVHETSSIPINGSTWVRLGLHMWYLLLSVCQTNNNMSQATRCFVSHVVYLLLVSFVNIRYCSWFCLPNLYRISSYNSSSLARFSHFYNELHKHFTLEGLWNFQRAGGTVLCKPWSNNSPIHSWKSIPILQPWNCKGCPERIHSRFRHPFQPLALDDGWMLHL